MFIHTDNTKWNIVTFWILQIQSEHFTQRTATKDASRKVRNCKKYLSYRAQPWDCNNWSRELAKVPNRLTCGHYHPHITQLILILKMHIYGMPLFKPYANLRHPKSQACITKLIYVSKSNKKNVLLSKRCAVECLLPRTYSSCVLVNVKAFMLNEFLRWKP